MPEEEARSPPHDVETELDREIGLIGAVAIGVGTMIAAGIFVLSGLAVSKVGAMAIVAFVLAGIVASFTAAAYAEFASIYPESGGGYMYVANTFQRDWTYIMGWTMILGYPASAAFYLTSFSDWTFRFIHPLLHVPETVPFWFSGVLVLALLVGINLKGTSESSKFQIVVTALKVALIALFLYGGLQAFNGQVVTDSFVENVDQLGNIGLTSALVFITFFGFSAIATNAEEIRSPGKTIPRAIYISMGLVTIIYALVVLVVVLAVNDVSFLGFLAAQVDLAGLAPEDFVAQNGEVSMALAAQYYLGDLGFYVIIVGALVSMLSAANATIMAGSRVKLAMARRRHLPRRFEQLHPRFNTPHRTVLLTGGLILLYMMVFGVAFGEEPGAPATEPLFGLHLGIEGIAQFANFLLLSGLTIVNVALIRSRRKFPDLERGFRVPFVPVVPVIAMVANLGLVLNVGATAITLGLLAEVVGLGLWLTWKSRPIAVEEVEEKTPTVVAEFRSPGKEYQVLVPISNPRNVEQLMRTAVALARAHDGEVLVLAIVTLPEQTPLSEGRRYAGEKRPIVDDALRFAEEAGVPASGVVRIGHHPADAILNTIDQHGSDAVLLGWRGGPSRRRDIVLGTTVDRVVAFAPCDVFVEKVGQPARGGLGSILLPTAGGPHAVPAATLARAIAAQTDATVRVANVVATNADAEAREAAEATVAQTASELGEHDVETVLLESDEVIDAILDESRQHDLTIIGATREGVFQRLVFGDIPEAIAKRSHHTVIMAKRNPAAVSRLKRWFQWR